MIGVEAPLSRKSSWGVGRFAKGGLRRRAGGFRRSSLRSRLVEQDRARDGRVERLDPACVHGNPDEQVTAPANRWSKTAAFAPDDNDRDRTSQVSFAGGQRGTPISADDPQAADVQIGQRAGKIVDRERAGGAPLHPHWP